MTGDSLSSITILKDLEEIYQRALDKGNLSVALKIKELLGREVGLFLPKKSSDKRVDLSLDRLSEEDINGLIEALQRRLKDGSS